MCTRPDACPRSQVPSAYHRNGHRTRNQLVVRSPCTFPLDNPGIACGSHWHISPRGTIRILPLHLHLIFSHADIHRTAFALKRADFVPRHMDYTLPARRDFDLIPRGIPCILAARSCLGIFPQDNSNMRSSLLPSTVRGRIQCTIRLIRISRRNRLDKARKSPALIHQCLDDTPIRIMARFQTLLALRTGGERVYCKFALRTVQAGRAV